MARFIKCGMRSAECGIFLFFALLVLPSGAGADDASTLLAAPHLPPYEWFASTDPKGQNADYIPLKPNETRRVPLTAGILARFWSTAFEPDKIVLRLENGRESVELLRDGKARLGVFHQKAFTFYPDESTPVRARVLAKDVVLVAMNVSKNENKWFYQVTVRPDRTIAKTSAAQKSEVVEKVTWDELDEHIRVPAEQGRELFSKSTPPTFQLHMAYGSARSQKGRPIPILRTTGEGAFVGLVLDIRPAPDTTRRTFAYLEGNEIISADGRTYEGTGTEDYFNSAWYYPEEPFAFPYHGMSFKGLEPPRVTTYRWMVSDAIPFKDRFRFDLEHGNGNNANDLEYRWVAFWYQKAPAEFEVVNALMNENTREGGSGSDINAKLWLTIAVAGAAIALLLMRRRQGKSNARS